MSGKIFVIGIKNLKTTCIVGVYELERVVPQDLYIDFKMQVQLRGNISEDEFRQTIDYVEIADLIQKIARETQCRLIERLASEILDEIISRFMPIKVKIRVKKPQAIIAADCAYVELNWEEKKICGHLSQVHLNELEKVLH